MKVSIDPKIVGVIIAVVVVIIGIFFFTRTATPPPREVNPFTGAPVRGTEAPGMTPDMPRRR